MKTFYKEKEISLFQNGLGNTLSNESKAVNKKQFKQELYKHKFNLTDAFFKDRKNLSNDENFIILENFKYAKQNKCINNTINTENTSKTQFKQTALNTITNKFDTVCSNTSVSFNPIITQNSDNKTKFNTISNDADIDNNLGWKNFNLLYSNKSKILIDYNPDLNIYLAQPITNNIMDFHRTQDNKLINSNLLKNFKEIKQKVNLLQSSYEEKEDFQSAILKYNKNIIIAKEERQREFKNLSKILNMNNKFNKQAEKIKHLARETTNQLLIEDIGNEQITKSIKIDNNKLSKNEKRDMLDTYVLFNKEAYDTENKIFSPTRRGRNDIEAINEMLNIKKSQEAVNLNTIKDLVTTTLLDNNSFSSKSLVKNSSKSNINKSSKTKTIEKVKFVINKNDKPSMLFLNNRPINLKKLKSEIKITYNKPSQFDRIPTKTVSSNNFNRIKRTEIKSQLRSDNYLHNNRSYLLNSRKNFLTTKQINKLQSKKETVDASYNQSTDRQEIKMKIQVKLNQLKEDKPQKVFKYLDINKNKNKNDISNISDSVQDVKEKKTKKEFSKFYHNQEESDFESVLSDNSINIRKKLKTNKAQFIVDSNFKTQNQFNQIIDVSALDKNVRVELGKIRRERKNTANVNTTDEKISLLLKNNKNNILSIKNKIDTLYSDYNKETAESTIQDKKLEPKVLDQVIAKENTNKQKISNTFKVESKNILYPWKIIHEISSYLYSFKDEILKNDLENENNVFKYKPKNIGNSTSYLEKYALLKNKILFDYVRKIDRLKFKSEKKHFRKVLVILDECVVITPKEITGSFIEIPTTKVSILTY